MLQKCAKSETEINHTLPACVEATSSLYKLLTPELGQFNPFFLTELDKFHLGNLCELLHFLWSVNLVYGWVT